MKTVYQGCNFKANQVISIQTASESAVPLSRDFYRLVSSQACGVHFNMTLGDYLVTGSFGDSSVFRVNSCQINRPVSSFTKEEQIYLRNWFSPCTNSCVTGGIVNCFMNPCQSTPCNVPLLIPLSESYSLAQPTNVSPLRIELLQWM